MSLEKVIAITGKPGLYKLIAQTRGGFVAESLIDKKRMSVNIQQNVSVLSEIAIYTLTEEVPLREVLKSIKKKENGGATSVKAKDGKDKLEEYFFEILPDYDEDRVYASDIKKVIQWYNLLLEHNMLDLEEDSEAKTEDVKSEEA
ncbi:DUF5606 domain-containing protein [Mariniflexile sp. AS56]|uniref:DUF5606 family protein n=1 Tax=Mariniflexile sp. AS56 TaxID=3063957 RepID=UPI0026EBA167|nr:DUF5606 domain-containing protein [Mariniflexile sp. AS56]MDO7171518.1 DUF5606 domain-containing protein [Mariniflexile sp. AS56]